MYVDQLLKKVVTVLFHFVLDLFSECHQNIDKSNSMQQKIKQQIPIHQQWRANYTNCIQYTTFTLNNLDEINHVIKIKQA